jgi:predicted acylesterase/phospholipase RssA
MPVCWNRFGVPAQGTGGGVNVTDLRRMVQRAHAFVASDSTFSIWSIATDLRSRAPSGDLPSAESLTNLWNLYCAVKTIADASQPSGVPVEHSLQFVSLVRGIETAATALVKAIGAQGSQPLVREKYTRLWTESTRFFQDTEVFLHDTGLADKYQFLRLPALADISLQLATASSQIAETNTPTPTETNTSAGQDLPRPNTMTASSSAPTATPANRVILALSGGGFRATLFHLGTIRALAEAGLLPKVSDIISVSGGSILAAHLTLFWSRYATQPKEFYAVAKEVVDFIQSTDIRGRVLRRWPRWFPLVGWALVLAPVMSVVGLAALGVCPWWSVGAVIVVLPILVRGVRRPQTQILADHYEPLYSRSRRSPALCSHLEEKSLPPRPSIHILATDFQRGDLVSFGAGYVERTGLSEDAGVPSTPPQKHDAPLLRLSSAVAASSAFPALFEPLWVDAKTLSGAQSREGNRWTNVSVGDGGVFDNLGLRRLDDILTAASAEGTTLCIVSDAGAPFLSTDRPVVWPAAVMRSVEVFMERIYTLQNASARSRPIVLRIGESRAKNRATRASIRTDLNRFTDLECRSLLHEGYEIAQDALEPHRAADAPGKSDPPDWFSAPDDEVDLAKSAERHALRSLIALDPVGMFLQIASLLLLASLAVPGWLWAKAYVQRVQERDSAMAATAALELQTQQLAQARDTAVEAARNQGFQIDQLKAALRALEQRKFSALLKPLLLEEVQERLRTIESRSAALGAALEKLQTAVDQSDNDAAIRALITARPLAEELGRLIASAIAGESSSVMGMPVMPSKAWGRHPEFASLALLSLVTTAADVDGLDPQSAEREQAALAVQQMLDIGLRLYQLALSVGPPPGPHFPPSDLEVRRSIQGGQNLKIALTQCSVCLAKLKDAQMIARYR